MLTIIDKALQTIQRPAAGGRSAGIELLRGEKTHTLEFEVVANLSITGGATSGTVNAEGLSRLINQMRLSENGRVTVDMSGRHLEYFTNRMLAQAGTFESLATGDIQANTVIRGQYVLTFADIFGADPSETAYIERDARFPTLLDFDFASDPQAALITGGDRTLTLNALTIFPKQLYDPVSKKPPFFIPRFQRVSSQGFNGAQSDFPVFIYPEGGHRLAGLIAHGISDGVTTSMLTGQVTFRGDRLRYTDQIQFRQVLNNLRRFYPGVTPQAGFLDLPFRRYGKLSEMYVVNQDQNPRLELAVNGAGTVNTFDVLTMEMAAIPGVTRAIPANW